MLGMWWVSSESQLHPASVPHGWSHGNIREDHLLEEASWQPWWFSHRGLRRIGRCPIHTRFCAFSKLPSIFLNFSSFSVPSWDARNTWMPSETSVAFPTFWVSFEAQPWINPSSKWLSSQGWVLQMTLWFCWKHSFNLLQNTSTLAGASLISSNTKQGKFGKTWDCRDKCISDRGEKVSLRCAQQRCKAFELSLQKAYRTTGPWSLLASYRSLWSFLFLSDHFFYCLVLECTFICKKFQVGSCFWKQSLLCSSG